jgi:hypothetical protein
MEGVRPRPGNRRRAIDPTGREQTKTMAQPQILVVREYAAPRDVPFRAFTDRELLVSWLLLTRLAGVC